jgi:hypothetical protein
VKKLRAVEDQAGHHPVKRKKTSELGRINRMDEGRSMRAEKESPATPSGNKWCREENIRSPLGLVAYLGVPGVGG